MIRKLFCLAALLVLATTRAALCADIVVAENGKTDYQVIVPDAAANPELAPYLDSVAHLVQSAFKGNGFEIPVVAESQRDPAKPGLYLGNTAFARSNGFDVAKVKDWGYVHKAVGRDIIIAGLDEVAPVKLKNPGAPAFNRVGTAKAIADFLRLYAGTRFLFPDAPGRADIKGQVKTDWLKSPAVEFLPTPAIAVPSDLDVAKTVPLKFNIAWAGSAGFYDLANNRFPIVDEVFGGHTYGRAISLEKYGKTNPEYFALVGGKRLVNPDSMAQFCISNPDVQELMFQDLILWLDAGYVNVDLGQPDGFRACQCEACKKLFDTGDDWSEKLWILHRNLAERLLKARPDKQVTLMSYILTANPPKTFKKFPKNVRIMLCGTNEEDIEAWRACEVPGGFTGYLYNWCANLGTRYTPMRTPRYVEKQVKRLVANHFQAINRDGPGALYGLEGPVYYTMGRMFDDAANSQAKDLVHEFCEGAFGKAAGPMLRFYDQLYDGIELYSEYLGTRCPAWSYTDIYGRRHKSLTDPFQFLGFLYPPRLLASLDKELTQAEKAANTDKIRARVALVRREFNYLRSLARVIHLHHAYEIQPDLSSRDRLLDAIDARNAEIDALFVPQSMKEMTQAGWAFVMFPIPGHNASHLRLAHDGYQEPFKNTCVNWDTQAMRQAPLPGSKSLSVTPAAGAVTLDSPAWEAVVAAALSPVKLESAAAEAAGGRKASLKTTLRALRDEASLYVRVESELPADSAKDLAKEKIELYLAPSAGRDVSYRFSVGTQAESKLDAASGFVTDVMDPRYGQFDPDWNGEWTVETRMEPAKNRWIALFRIPFKTLGAEPPAAGIIWRGNVARIHPLSPTQVESSLWSAAPNTKTLEDKTAFGEWAFDAGAGKAAQSDKNAAQVWREQYNAKTGEFPAEWKTLPNLLPAPLGPWTFRADPIDQGVKANWFAADVNTADWVPVKVPGFWGETEAVGDFQGFGWYRTTFTVPAEWTGKAVRLLFAAVDEQAWVYVNGRLVREHSEKSEGKGFQELWEQPFTADVPPEGLNYGKPNVVAVRVNNSTANGGMWRPVMAHAVELKK
jgi:hypothetical protein